MGEANVAVLGVSGNRNRARETASLQIIDTALADAVTPCITCSFQAGGMVLLHMLRACRPDVPVLFLDTVHHFAETYAYRDRIATLWRLNLVTLRASEPARGLWHTSTDACCQRHKVEPLFAALEVHDVWFSGLRREQSPSRAGLQEGDWFELPSGTRLKKVSPLARWTTEDVRAYANAHEIPLHPLHDAGYTSIGCAPCSAPPPDPASPRSGRWRGEKLECGIHLQELRT